MFFVANGETVYKKAVHLSKEDKLKICYVINELHSK